MPLLAVGFFGLVYRNLANTIPSLERHLFAVLDTAPLVYEVFVHTFMVQAEEVHVDGQVIRVSLDPYSFILLRPCIFEVEDQHMANAEIRRRQKSMVHALPDLWHDNYRSLRNYLIALRSVERLAAIIYARETVVGARFDMVLIARADTRLLCDVDLPSRMAAILVAEHERMREPVGARKAGIVTVPIWGHFGGVNDRFAYGARDPMLRLYCGRERWAWLHLAADTHMRNGEQLLKYVLRDNGVDIRHTSMIVQRFRPLGLRATDVLSMRDDTVEHLRDELSHLIERPRRKRKWWRNAGRTDRGTTAAFICRLASQGVRTLGTWTQNTTTVMI